MDKEESKVHISTYSSHKSQKDSHRHQLEKDLRDNLNFGFPRSFGFDDIIL